MIETLQFSQSHLRSEFTVKLIKSIVKFMSYSDVNLLFHSLIFVVLLMRQESYALKVTLRFSGHIYHDVLLEANFDHFSFISFIFRCVLCEINMRVQFEHT